MNNLAFILATVQKAHSLCDKEMESLTSVCKEGCDSCCYQIAYTNAWEEVSLIDYIHKQIGKNTRSFLKDNLEKWFLKFNSITREASRSAPLTPTEMDAVEYQFREQRVACPMLIKGACSVYEVRPLICRVHIEPADPSYCRRDPHKITCPEARLVFEKVIDACKYDPSIYPLMSKPIAYAIAGEIGLRSKIKSKAFVGIVSDHRLNAQR